MQSRERTPHDHFELVPAMSFKFAEVHVVTFGAMNYSQVLLVSRDVEPNPGAVSNV